MQQKYPGTYEQRGENMGSFRPPAGESFTDVAARALPALHDIARSSPGTILIVAHAGVNRVLLASLQHTPIDALLTIPQNYCCVNILSCSNNVLSVQQINQIHY